MTPEQWDLFLNQPLLRVLLVLLVLVLGLRQGLRLLLASVAKRAALGEHVVVHILGFTVLEVESDAHLTPQGSAEIQVTAGSGKQRTDNRT